ncbi:MAG: efflux RND transporter periplasmic adaptor subunit [Gemmatimonadaceae bacterium]|nr:efflux RND transporter periplasmic adaptor subunit [Gemmatimonadaceae bacterium]
MLLALCAVGACSKPPVATPTVQPISVERRDLVIDAQATGTVEPINVIEVKSKASGIITRMTVETGTKVSEGDLLVQVDTRDVKNQFDQATADLRAAQAGMEVAQSQKKRSDELFASRIITATENEQASLSLTQAQAQVVRAKANLDLAKQRLEDATVTAPSAGTVIEKTVSQGQVITSATGAFGGGTTLLKMADLTKVRMRALVNETDIGNIKAGQSTRVIVDAYPDKTFRGSVEKIEPQAVVQQSVTLFPVIVSLDNPDGLLKPGMNGEASMMIARHDGVLSVPNDAVRSPREAATAAALVGLSPDSVTMSVQAQMTAVSAMGGARPGRPTGDAPNAAQVPSARDAGAAATGGRGGRTGRRSGETNGARDGAAGAGDAPAARARPALVFVAKDGRFEPRVIRVGATNYDFAEVVSGLAEGDKVASLAVAALQAKRDEQNSRFRSMTGGGMPGMQRQGGGGGGGAGGGGGGGGGPPSGGRAP